MYSIRLAVAFLFGALASTQADAYDLGLDDISYSYSNCSFRDNGDGTSVASVDIDYRSASGHVGAGSGFFGRGILVYAYDKNGKPVTSSAPATSVTLNGVRYGDLTDRGGYLIYVGYTDTVWHTWNPFVARVRATIPNWAISDWPAVSIQAANVTAGGADLGEIKGSAYIVKDGVGGSCKVIPYLANAPPLDMNITVTAPDWNLGDLQQGESSKTFSLPTEQLCFDYSAASVQNQKFIISASNANGVVNNRYQLQHLSDSTQKVPYRLTLDSSSGSASLQLPNNSTAIPLDGSGRTCFAPTFTTEVGQTVKDGDYSDVLTFTVTTPS